MTAHYSTATLRERGANTSLILGGLALGGGAYALMQSLVVPALAASR
jgi:hypothetical protein